MHILDSVHILPPPHPLGIIRKLASLVFKHKFTSNLVLFNWGFQSSISVSSQSGISELLDNNRFALEKWKCKVKSGSSPTPTPPHQHLYCCGLPALPDWRACSMLMEAQWALLWELLSCSQIFTVAEMAKFSWEFHSTKSKSYA